MYLIDSNLILENQDYKNSANNFKLTIYNLKVVNGVKENGIYNFL